MAEPRNSMRNRVSRALGVAAVVGGLVLVGSSQLRMQFIVDDLDQEVRDRTAALCVAAHDRTVQIRDGDEKTYRRLTNTLIEASGETDPARIEQFRVLIERDVKEIRAQQKEPPCDLAEAQAVLDGTNAGKN